MQKTRLGFLLTEEKTKQINIISSAFRKTPEKFIDDIIESTYKKITELTLEWDDDEQ